MAELLIRLADDPGRPAGEVLAIRPDGHPWTARDTGTRRRVIRVPDLDDGLRTKLLAAQQPAEPMPADDLRRRTLHARAYRLEGAAFLPAQVTAATIAQALIEAPSA